MNSSLYMIVDLIFRLATLLFLVRFLFRRARLTSITPSVKPSSRVATESPHRCAWLLPKTGRFDLASLLGVAYGHRFCCAHHDGQLGYHSVFGHWIRSPAFNLDRFLLVVHPAAGDRQFYQPRQLPSGAVFTRGITCPHSDAVEKHPADRGSARFFAHGLDLAVIHRAAVAATGLWAGVSK